MKKVIQNILGKLGVRIVKEEYYKSLVNMNILDSLDFFHSLKKIIKTSDNLICFDIGANIGQTALKLSKYFPNAIIYSFEPMQTTFATMEQNLSGLQNIRIFNFALGARQEEMEVIYQENSEWNSLVKEQNSVSKGENVLSEIVQVKTVDNLVSEYGMNCIDFLKTDTEGYELEVFKGAEESIASGKIKVIYVEVGFSKTDKQHNYWIEIIQFLEGKNYHFAGLYERSYGLNLEIIHANALFVYNN